LDLKRLVRKIAQAARLPFRTAHGFLVNFQTNRSIRALSRQIEALEKQRGAAGMSSARLEALGDLYVSRGKLRDSPSDFEDALPPYISAMTGDPVRETKLKFKIADAVARRSMYFGTPDKVAEGVRAAVSMFREIAADTSASVGTRVEAQIKAAHAVRILHELSGHPDVLNAMITEFENALVLAESAGDDQVVARVCSDLATAVAIRYRHQPNDRDLVRAITLYNRALDSFSEKAPERPVAEHNLATFLRNFYEMSGSVSVLDQAIAVQSASVAHTKRKDSRFAPRQADLGLLIFNRAAYGIYLGKTPDKQTLRTLDRAISLMEKAIPGEISEGSMVGYAANLAGTLVARYDYTHSLTDLTRAVDWLNKARAFISVYDPVGANLLLGNLARTQLVLAQHTSSQTDLGRAVDNSRQASEQAALHGSSDYFRYKMTLGQGLRLRYQLGHNGVDRDEALQVFGQACVSASAPSQAMQAAREWGELAEEISWATAAQAYGHGLAAMQSLVAGQLLRTEKEHWIEVASDLNARAAFALAKSGDFVSAVVALEKSRAMLHSSLLEADEVIGELVGIDKPDLLERFRGAAHRLRELRRAELGSGSLVSAIYSQMLAAQSDYQQVLREIGPLPDDSTAVIGRVRAAAVKQPLVYLLSHRLGGLGLIVNPSGEVSPVELPALRLDDIFEIAKAHFSAYNDRFTNRSKWRSQLEATLSWLWDSAMRDVVASFESGTRIALIPLGLLGLLPIHAAGHKESVGVIGDWALDHCAISYAPNARTLLAAQAQLDVSKPVAIAAIGEPRPVTAAPLRYADAEALIVGSLFATGKNLFGPDAVIGGIVPAMEAARVSHFACHGVTVYSDTLSSYLLLANDAQLTVRKMLSMHLPKPRLVTLSACDTGLIDTRFPDEVVALPSACMVAGFSAAIGTMWSVSDGSTALLMARFYDNWLRGEVAPAEALRQAQNWIRASTVQQLREYVRACIGSRDQQGWMPTSAGEQLLAYLSTVTAQDALRHPFYWGAFVYYGA
jgi:CHAT domain-containing protein